ncbi:DUF4962 domain-containing protein [uncultured Fibrella sp.]|uniref:DUF4962 domain-containing protein n=1 Tax=uncultured Fibrella sp. TaxID=1284596 RepID=UPI0035CC0C43
MKNAFIFLFCLYPFLLFSQTPDSLLATLRPGHPRLYVTGLATFDSIRERLPGDPFLKRCADSVSVRADRMLTLPVSTYSIPDGLRLLATSGRVLDRAQTLSMAYRLTGDKRYADRLYAELEAVARFPNWNPRHFLDTAEMTHAFALSYDWLYDYWTPVQRKVLKEAIVEHGLMRAYLAYTGRATKETSWWPAVEHNWNQVCNGGIGLGALAVADEEPKLCETLLENVVKLLPIAMKNYASDGAWNEGPAYWGYATRYTINFLAGMESALGRDAGLSKIPGFEPTGLFVQYTMGPLNRTFNYADGNDVVPHEPSIFWLARRFNQPTLTAFNRNRSDYRAMDLIWAPAQLAVDATAPALPLDRYFRTAEVMTMRSSWTDPKAVFTGIKAGSNAVNHSNLDIGSFVLDANGYRWAVDLGGDNYNLPNYFQTTPDGQRWTYYRMRAEGHNTLVLNPSTKADQYAKAETKITRYDTKPDRAFAIADLTPAYGGATGSASVQHVRRGLMLLNRTRPRLATVVVQDEITADQPTDVNWFMQTPAQISFSTDGRTATLTQEGETLTARIVSPANARFGAGHAEPSATSPHPPKQNENKGIQRLSVHLPGFTTGTLAIEFVPNGARSTLKTLRPLDSW